MPLKNRFIERVLRQLSQRRLIFSRLLTGLVLISMSIGIAVPMAVFAQASDPASQLLTSLTPEEKVGQLFLVSFTGTDVGDQSQI